VSARAARADVHRGTRRGAATAAGRAAAAPRRVSGPARSRPEVLRPVPGGAIAARRLVDAADGVASSRAVDRLVGGRAWIALLAVALIGIVAMQVHTLRLNAQIGRDVERIDELRRVNSAARSEVSRLSAGERIQATAAQLGLVMPSAGDVTYLEARDRDFDAEKAVATMRAPTPGAAEEAELLARQHAAGLLEGGAAAGAEGAVAPGVTGEVAPEAPGAVAPEVPGATGAVAPEAPGAVAPEVPGATGAVAPEAPAAVAPGAAGAVAPGG